MLAILIFTTTSTFRAFITEGSLSSYGTILWILDTSLYLSATALLFTKRANAWFDRANAAQNVGKHRR